MRLKRFLVTIAFFLFTVGFMLISVDFALLNPHFYRTQFAKYNCAEEAGIDERDLKTVTNKLIEYFSGRTDNLQVKVTFTGENEPSNFYGEAELSHMHDVKVLIIVLRTVAIIVMALSLGGIVAISFLDRKNAAQNSSFGAIVGCGTFLSIFAIIGIILLIDFDGAFTVFHKMFFPQGNWQFDWSSAMIRLLPSEIFLNGGIIILVSGIGFAALCLLSGVVYRITARVTSQH